MPTERFSNLPEEKKRMIREAAVKEFCRVPLEKASINKIVQNADISRGSFYTYFRDKEDVLAYIIEDVIASLQDYARNTLRNNLGEFWEFSSCFLDYVLKVCEENRLFSLMQSVSGNGVILRILNPCSYFRKPPFEKNEKQGLKAYAPPLDPNYIKQQINRFEEELYQLTDCSKLRINSFQEFHLLYELFTMNVVAVIDDIYRKGIEKKDARQSFCRRLDYLKYGVAKC